MAALLNDDELDAPTATTAPVNTTTTSGTGDTSGGTSAPSPLNAPVNGTTANQQDVSAITGLNKGVDFSPLMDYVKGQGTAARDSVNSANANFNTALGTGPGSFGQAQQDTLSGVINGSQPLSTGSSLLNNTYGGPSGIDSTSYQPLIDKYSTSAGQTQNSSGIDALLQSMRPDLTPGERSYDALNFGANPNYQAASRDLVNDSADVMKFGSDTGTNAINQVNQRQSDINAFNAAGTGYVTSQRDALNAALAAQINQAQQSDTAQQQLYNQYQQLAPQNITSQVGGDFNQAISPSLYGSYTPGGIVSRNSVATGAQATQFNNEEQLLNLYDRLQSTGRTGATAGFNQNALLQALQQASAARDSSDAAWLLAHQPAPVAAADPEPPPLDTSDPPISLGGGDAGGSGDGGGGDGFFRGGLVKKRNTLDYGTPRGNRPTMPQATTTPVQQLAASMTQQQNPSLLQTKGTGFMQGGYIPVGTGNPNVKDDVPVNVDDGEFVLRAPSVNAVGSGNMAQLNHINQLPPAKQQMVRHALHTALHHAINQTAR